MIMAYGLLLCSIMAGGWLAVQVALRSWGRPERLDASWAWTRPAPCIGDWQGPLRPPATPARPAEGATEEWSPVAEYAAVEQRRLPLDDVDEWLAVRLAAFEHELMAIGARARGADGAPSEIGWSVDVELDAFQRGSMGLHEYRSMVLDSTGSYGPREHMQLEELLTAA
jgi:hypothetical protein